MSTAKNLQKPSSIWVSRALIFITLALALLGVFKDLIPEKKIPSWLILSTGILTGIGAVAQAYQDNQGLKFSKNVSATSEGISEDVAAPKKPLTAKEEDIYENLKAEARHFRSAKIKLFFSPSLTSESLYDLGLIAFNQRDFAEAEKNLKYSLKLDSNNIKTFNLLLQLYQSTAMMHLDQRDFEKAARYLGEAERLISESSIEGDWETITLLGYIYKSLGQVHEKEDLALSEKYWQSAGRIFRKVLAHNPENANALNGLGNVLAHEGNFKEALEQSQAALELAPNYTAAANDVALVYESLMTKEPERADTWRQQAIDHWKLSLQLSETDPQFDDNYCTSIRQHIQYLQAVN